MSPLQGVLRLFCDLCHTIGAIQVAADCVLDQPRRLVECTFVLKTGLFNLRYQVNWVHMKGFLILFHMRYSSLSSDKNGQMAIKNVEGCLLRLALLRKTTVQLHARS